MNAKNSLFPGRPCAENRSVVIYRNQLFKPSEPFIALQARHLPSFHPIFVGRERWAPAAAGQQSIVIESGGRIGKFVHALCGRSRELNREVAKHKPALVHAHFGVDALYGASLARSLGVPLIATLHGFDVTVGRAEFLNSRSPALVRYGLSHRSLARYATRLLCVSEFIRNKAIEFGFPEERLLTHYIGIDLSQFTPTPYTRGEVFRILHVARLVEKKGTRYLLEALLRLPERVRRRVRLDVIGEGPLRAELEAMTTREGLTGNVAFHGVQTQAQVQAHLQSSDLLCLPSVTAGNGDAEGLGMVVLEAAASGLPVLATRHGGIPEAVVDGETGLLVAERDAFALADAIAFLVESETVRQRMGRSGRARVERQFDVVKQCSTLERVYSEIAEAR
ncbi:glycosyltransferase [Burkholderia vietnamiensis]|jgi:glycosyltransferase involved in cell wall biosynthesis|uniref:glycosyltransferase n=1 Tax=Burkholderia vietnamiensis TaxID=60552 RepID=UPI001B95D998|nr:glycosyltransferase [Burkholderia vietnamiensis]MBR7919370.1 glycosyltransferase [Burkholderia vietnamiensis]HDR9356409.1 glycosyltransferase [Burkholderia vietnamiensis]